MTTPVADNSAPASETPAEGTADESQQLGEGGIKALQAERDARKAAEKAATELQAQIDALNAEKLSDLEKAQLEAKTAQEAAAKAAKEALRYKYAAKHGISEEDAELFLTGETEDAVAAQAERLAARASSPNMTPKPDLTQGGAGTPPTGSKGDIFASFLESKLS